MDQNEIITVKFEKEESFSVEGNKFYLSYNANKMLDLLDVEKNEINIDLSKSDFNISSKSFEVFVKASFGDDINFESQDAFEIQKLCQIYGNNSLLSDINEFIEQIEEPQKAILQFRLDENQNSLKYICNNFPKCATYDDFTNLDLKYIDKIFSSEEFKNHISSEEYQHSLARYLVKISRNENKRLGAEIVFPLIEYSKLLPADIKDIITCYPEVEKDLPDSALSSIKTIHDIIKRGNQILDDVDHNFDSMIKDRENIMKSISKQLKDIKDQKETIFSSMDEQRTRIYFVKSQNDHLENIQGRHEYIKNLYDKATEYQKKINESLNNLDTRISELDSLSSQIAKNSNE